MNIMRMALTQSCCRNLDKSAVFLQLFDALRSTITHTGAKTAHQLEYRIFYQTLVCNTTFYAFRNELLGVGLEVAILAAVFHRSDGTHAAVTLYLRP